MGPTSYVSKWGSSLAIRIPRIIANQWGVQEGSAIEIVADGDEVILRKKSYDLSEMLAQVTEENLHVEQDFGPPQGKEVW